MARVSETNKVVTEDPTVAQHESENTMEKPEHSESQTGHQEAHEGEGLHQDYFEGENITDDDDFSMDEEDMDLKETGEGSSMFLCLMITSIIGVISVVLIAGGIGTWVAISKGWCGTTCFSNEQYSEEETQKFIEKAEQELQRDWTETLPVKKEDSKKPVKDYFQEQKIAFNDETTWEVKTGELNGKNIKGYVLKHPPKENDSVEDALKKEREDPSNNESPSANGGKEEHEESPTTGAFEFVEKKHADAIKLAKQEMAKSDDASTKTLNAVNALRNQFSSIIPVKKSDKEDSSITTRSLDRSSAVADESKPVETRIVDDADKDSIKKSHQDRDMPEKGDHDTSVEKKTGKDIIKELCLEDLEVDDADKSHQNAVLEADTAEDIYEDGKMDKEETTHDDVGSLSVGELESDELIFEHTGDDEEVHDDSCTDCAIIKGKDDVIGSAPVDKDDIGSENDKDDIEISTGHESLEESKKEGPEKSPASEETTTPKDEKSGIKSDEEKEKKEEEEKEKKEEEEKDDGTDKGTDDKITDGPKDETDDPADPAPHKQSETGSDKDEKEGESTNKTEKPVPKPSTGENAPPGSGSGESTGTGQAHPSSSPPDTTSAKTGPSLEPESSLSREPAKPAAGVDPKIAEADQALHTPWWQRVGSFFGRSRTKSLASKDVASTGTPGVDEAAVHSSSFMSRMKSFRLFRSRSSTISKEQPLLASLEGAKTLKTPDHTSGTEEFPSALPCCGCDAESIGPLVSDDLTKTVVLGFSCAEKTTMAPIAEMLEPVPATSCDASSVPAEVSVPRRSGCGPTACTCFPRRRQKEPSTRACELPKEIVSATESGKPLPAGTYKEDKKASEGGAATSVSELAPSPAETLEETLDRNIKLPVTKTKEQATRPVRCGSCLGKLCSRRTRK